MLYDGINLDEGSEIFNTTVASGSINFPMSPNVGELFFKIAPAKDQGLYIHDGIRWNKLSTNDSISIPNGTEFPLFPSIGDVFYLDSNDSNESLYFWNGTTWIQTGGACEHDYSGPEFPNESEIGQLFYLTSGEVGAYIKTENGWVKLMLQNEIGCGCGGQISTSFKFYRFKATNSNNQTFSGLDLDGKLLSFTNDSILIFANGAAMQPSIDFTSDVNSSSITFDIPRDIDDEISISVFNNFTNEPISPRPSNNINIDSVNSIKVLNEATSQYFISSDDLSFLRVISPTHLLFAPPSQLNISPGSIIDIEQSSLNGLTFVQTAGAKIFSPASLKTNKQYARVRICAIDEHNWAISGDLETSDFALFEFNGQETAEITPSYSNMFLRVELGNNSSFLESRNILISTENNEKISVGTKIEIQNATASKLILVGGDGVYFETGSTTTITPVRHEITTLRKVSPNNWVIYGNLSIQQ